MKVCPDCQSTLKSWDFYCPKCSREIGNTLQAGLGKTKKEKSFS